ncbi:hypothetical protein [Aureibacillus halotolerans]|uniref:Uncharacterized protein n=1 Tax=Aureibacillus halotolerans TaxID=1508390 RepID=A0A4R6U9K2_9BACI|nr:hypothetical protein [Aureibacillus halotolerans]TDQ39754.1 hypothetical protein EV213_107121 [Aureibacillus halotolerans]
MAFGIKRHELMHWKRAVARGEIAFLTHYWIHPDKDDVRTITKAGCRDVDKLVKWGATYGLKKEWIHFREAYPHFDLFGHIQWTVLKREGLDSHLVRFQIKKEIDTL